MNFTVEQANPDQHYDALAHFLNHFEPDPIAAADIREWDRRSEGHIVRRNIVRDTDPNQTGEVIGYGVVHHGPWNQPQEFYLWVGVAAEKRRQGIGQQLYDDAVAFIQSLDGNALTSEIAEDDDPGSEGIFPSFEQFSKDLFDAPWYQPEGQWLAADGDHIIGMCAVGYFQASNSMYNMMTGVDSAYRGRGIAQALKVLAIRWAKAYGADYIRTNNNSENAPMLAINRKLGYVPQPGLYQMIKQLNREEQRYD